MRKASNLGTWMAIPSSLSRKYLILCITTTYFHIRHLITLMPLHENRIEVGEWKPEKRKNYNLLDAVSRYAIQVYPKSWAAIMLTTDNAGMWQLRNESPERAYLGQQMYISVLSPERSIRDEYNLPDNSLVCGAVKSMPKPPPYSI